MAKLRENAWKDKGVGRRAAQPAVRSPAQRKRIARVGAQLSEISEELLRTPLKGEYLNLRATVAILDQLLKLEIEAEDIVAEAFAPGPRARALLRGKEIAARDLADSGGAYSLEEVRRLLNDVSRQSVEKRVREGDLLAILGPNNKRYYPVAQFLDDGSVVAGLRAVQDALATRNGYAVLNFLVNSDPRLGNLRPLELLKQGELAKVVDAAAWVGEPGA